MTLECLVCGATLESHEIKHQEQITMFRLIHENHDSLATLEKEPEMTVEIKVETQHRASCSADTYVEWYDTMEQAQDAAADHMRRHHHDQYIANITRAAKAAAWDQGFTAHAMQTTKQRLNPNHPITRSNPHK